MRTCIERTMLQVIDAADHIGGLLRRKALNRMILGKGPQGIARLHATAIATTVEAFRATGAEATAVC